jgi:hypothetical protein
VKGGTEPWAYPGSAWKKGNMYGDFKPNSPPGQQAFQSEVQSGKWPENTQYIPYDSDTGNIGL